MAAILHTLDQRRLIDSNGIADGASIYFYTTGTLTPAAVYTTAALSTAHSSPIVVAAGAAVPDIYLDSNITYRRRIVYPDGSVDDTDPYNAGAVLSAELAATTGAALAGTSLGDTLEDASAAVGPRVSTASAYTQMAAIVSDIGGTTGDLGFGSIAIPSGGYTLSSTLLSAHQSLQIRGVGRPRITWTGAVGTGVISGGVPTGGIMFRIQDSTAPKLENMVLLGGGLVPDAAIFLDDTNGNNITSGTNESLSIADVYVGRDWTQNAESNSGVDNGFNYGIYVGGPNLTNNDTIFIARTAIFDCNTAGILFASNQSIWGSLSDLDCDTCGYGIDSRSNTQGRNLCFNRNTIADLRIRDDTIHDIVGFNAENSVLLIEQSLNASIRINGGKAKLSPTTMTGSYWATFAATKDVHFENWWVDGSLTTASQKKVQFTSSSTQRGRILIRHCRLPNGDLRSGYELNAGAASCGLRFDIEEGSFRCKGTLDGSMALDPASLAVNNSSSSALAMAAGAGISAGDPVLASFDVDPQGMLVVGNAYTANNLYLRIWNKTAGTLDLGAGKVRWRKIASSEMKAKATSTVDLASIAYLDRLGTAINVPCALGDFVYWGCSIDHRALVLNAYVSSANVVTINALNISGSAVDLASATYTACVIRESAFDYIGAIATDPASIADGAGLSITVAVPGAAVGDMAVASFSLDLQGLSHTAQITAADTATIRLHNETGAAVDLASLAIRVGTMTMPG